MTARQQAMLGLVLGAAVLGSGAAAGAAEFDEAEIFYELNATDGDVGIQVFLDAESWKEVTIKNPRGRRILRIVPDGSLRRIGLTELAFEGTEPPLEEVSFARFRELFPEGDYVFTGTTTGGQVLRSTAELTAALPCPVEVVEPSEDEPAAADGLVVSWQPSPGIYDPDAARCDTARDVTLTGYQVVVTLESEEQDILREIALDLAPGVTSVAIPAAFVESGAGVEGTAFKLEVLTIEESGNRTITEQEFAVE